MALETGSHIDDLVATNPASSDPLHQIDEHLRLIKAVIKATFPGADRALLDSVGKLLLANVPNLPASRITTGRFDVDRVAWSGSQTDYDALTPDEDTIYFITS